MSEVGLTWVPNPTVARTPVDAGSYLCLAPMDGVTCAIYREVITGLFGGRSGVSACVSEFVRVTHQPVPPHVFFRHCPELRTGGCTAAGVPVHLQLLGGEPEPMAEAARVAVELGAPVVDLNYGCPAKTVNGSDGGAVLLKCPARVEAVTGAVRSAVPATIPVSVKVRLGWENATAVEDIARAAEAGGASWLTVHARTRSQLYRPPVDWSAIARARRAVTIPVVANGDLFSLEALARCRVLSECDAFMIGRGAMGHPGLFARARGSRDAPLDSEALAQLIRGYATLLLERGTEPKRVPGRVKQWLRMAAPLREDAAQWFGRAKRAPSLEGVLAEIVPSRHAA